MWYIHTFEFSISHLVIPVTQVLKKHADEVLSKSFDYTMLFHDPISISVSNIFSSGMKMLNFQGSAHMSTFLLINSQLL